MPRPRLATERRESCARQKKKCSFAPGRDTCERCLEYGHNCRGSTEKLASVAKMTRNRFKCDHCRIFSLKCNPKGRVWPDRCEYCQTRGLPCTEPKTKRQAELAQGITLRGGTYTESPLEQTIHVAPVHRASALTPQSVSLGSEPEDLRPSSSPPAPLREHKEGSNENTEQSELEQLRTMVQIMEDEFLEVLRAEQQKHQEGIWALKDRHIMELDQLRKKYEIRIDSFIQIIKNLGE
ncbi:hypothetical protein GGR52DRAFT_383538 [Hypoxylon sp. FL1284]|nr:hypothetical protein GGR52DRAFT_383538 [Hypoxylon sp. FL1284]